MIRFRNPACDLQGMVRIFSVVYLRLKERETFGIEDMTQAIVGANLMSSSGYTGKRALAQGASPDKRLDKTYNNSKMFSEWFRLLGWIASVGSSALEFRFTYLGIHVATCKEPAALLEECLLGINNPNGVLHVKYTEQVRFFRCLLRTMVRMDGVLCRDEMILGPMCTDDNSEAAFSAMLARLQAIRGDQTALDTAFQTLCQTLGMKESSVRNCTRFPLSALRYCGWAKEYRDHTTYAGCTMKFFELTEYGQKRAEELEQISDLRLKEFILQTPDMQEALIRQGFYQMMARSGFDIAAYSKGQAAQDMRCCEAMLAGRPLYFSPYQTITAQQADAALGIRQEAVSPWPDLFAREEPSPVVTALPQTESAPTLPLSVKFSTALHSEQWDAHTRTVAAALSAQLETGRTPGEVAAAALEQYRQANQTVFYPLIASLFQILGYHCTASRQGDNAARWDAIIVDEEQSVPIEIKSPMEEQNLSVKAIRQALENKVVLLSRKTYPTTTKCSTLAVGFLPPNARADVAALIADIKKTFGISVAAVDFGSLVTLAVQTLQNQVAPERRFVQSWEGIVHVDAITTTESLCGDPMP